MDKYAHYVYSITKEFPKDELYGITSQLRRASLSVVLNKENKVITTWATSKEGWKGGKK